MATKKKSSVKKTPASAAKGNSTLELIEKQSRLDPKVWGLQQATGKIDHFITKKRASKLVKNFNNRTVPLPKNAFMQPENFDKGIIQELLNMDGCKMLRVYFGLNEFNKIRLVLVGADGQHNDLYLTRPIVFTAPDKNQAQRSKPGSAMVTGESGTEEGAVDFGQSCPAYGSGNIETLP